MTTRRKTATKKRLRHQTKEAPLRLPFIDHLVELRRRIFYVAISVALFSTIAYFFQQQIVNWLLAPAGNQKFIYTSVGGGIDFLFRVCLYTGIVFSIPVIIYQVLRYLQPLIGKHSTRFIVIGSLTSGVLALVGILFGYYLGLPAALNFLLNQFETSEISALITIQSYLSFVLLYLAGASLMFQVPLVIYFINRIKPLTMRGLFRQERWVILISFVVAAIINPSPRAQDMTILAIPMILSYQLGIIIVWHVNRKHTRPAHVLQLLEQDSAARRKRQERLRNSRHVQEKSDTEILFSPAAEPVAVSEKITSSPLEIQPETEVKGQRIEVAHEYTSDYINLRKTSEHPST